MITFQIIKIDENRPKIVVLIFIILIVILVLLYNYNLITENLLATLGLICGLSLFAFIRLTKKIINLGSIQINDTDISVNFNNSLKIYKINSFKRFRLRYSGFQDEIQTSNFLYYNFSSGVGKIDLIDKNGLESTFDIFIKNYDNFKLIKRKFQYLNENYSGIFEIIREKN